MENLGGCEAHIAEYRRVKDTANQEAAKKVQERVAEKQRQQKERDDSIAIAIANSSLLECFLVLNSDVPMLFWGIFRNF